MKRILFPTDFSSAAQNALKHAVALCQKTKAELLLFHAYYLPTTDPFTNDALRPGIADALHQRAEDQLDELALQLRRQYPELKVSYVAQMGFAAPEICAVAEEKNADLIVMGTKGENDIVHRVFGSVTINVLEDSPVPVYVVPKECPYQPIEKLHLAVDIMRLDVYTLAQAANFCKAMDCSLQFFTVLHPRYGFERKQVEQVYQQLKQMFYWNASIDYVLMEAKNVIEGIKHYGAQFRPVLMGMAKHYRRFFELLLRSSVTEKVVSHTHAPLLVFHTFVHP